MTPDPGPHRNTSPLVAGCSCPALLKLVHPAGADEHQLVIVGNALADLLSNGTPRGSRLALYDGIEGTTQGVVPDLWKLCCFYGLVTLFGSFLTLQLFRHLLPMGCHTDHLHPAVAGMLTAVLLVSAGVSRS